MCGGWRFGKSKVRRSVCACVHARLAARCERGAGIGRESSSRVLVGRVPDPVRVDGTRKRLVREDP